MEHKQRLANLIHTYTHTRHRLIKEPHEVLLENDVGHPILSNVVITRVHRVLTSMLKIQNNVSAIVSQNDPKFIGDMISAKIYQKFKNTVGEMVSARIWGRFWCINYRLWQPWRNKIMVVGVLSLAPCYVGKSRYVELIRLHILVNCMELRWRQPCSDPVAPCKYKQVSCNCKTVRVKEVLHLFRCYTHTHPACSGVWFLEDHRSKCRQN